MSPLTTSVNCPNQCPFSTNIYGTPSKDYPFLKFVSRRKHKQTVQSNMTSRDVKLSDWRQTNRILQEWALLMWLCLVSPQRIVLPHQEKKPFSLLPEGDHRRQGREPTQSINQPCVSLVTLQDHKTLPEILPLSYNNYKYSNLSAKSATDRTAASEKDKCVLVLLNRNRPKSDPERKKPRLL